MDQEGSMGQLAPGKLPPGKMVLGKLVPGNERMTLLEVIGSLASSSLKIPVNSTVGSSAILCHKQKGPFVELCSILLVVLVVLGVFVIAGSRPPG